jgi:hypothetical protein
LSWVVDSLEIINPTLVGVVVALVPLNVSVVSVTSSVNIEASNTDISDVSSASTEPSDHLSGVVGFVWSDNSWDGVLHPVGVTLSDGDNHSSVGSNSDGLGSPVEHPPLLVVIRIVVSDSESVLG